MKSYITTRNTRLYLYSAITIMFITQTGLFAQPIKVMPMGNSVTRGSQCLDGSIKTCTNRIPDKLAVGYRGILGELLRGAGYEIDFIGSRRDGYQVLDDPENAGFSGIRSWQLLNIFQDGTSGHSSHSKVTKGPYLNFYTPDIILLQVGTNDVTDKKYSADSVGKILDLIRNYEIDSNIKILTFVAKIIGRRDYVYNTYEGTVTYNSNLQTIVQSKINLGYNVVLIDMEAGAGIDYSTDMADELHPNDTGYKKMAHHWFNSINSVNTAPVISKIPGQAIYTGENFEGITLDNYVIDIEDPDSNITWQAIPSISNNFEITISENRVATIAPINAEWTGSDTITFVATDKGKYIEKLKKTDTTRAIFTVLTKPVINQPPVILSIPDTTVKAGDLYVYELKANDPENDPLTFTTDSIPGWVSFDNMSQKLEGTPGISEEGAHNIKIIVSDGTNNVPHNFTITVTNEIDSVVGLETRYAQPTFMIYPIPANSSVNFEISNNDNKSLKLFISNNIGQIIKVADLSGLSGYKLDVSQYPSDTYYYKIVSSHNTITGKFLVY